MQHLTVLGLMSGTSMDGLDCGLFDISLSPQYKLEWSCVDFITFSYRNNVRQSIINALSKGDKYISIANNILGNEFARKSIKFLNGRNIDLISLHGQTVAHSDGESTLQVGNPETLYEYLKVPVVFNIRQADILVGGNGAPLMPFLDWLLFKEEDQDVITLNLGGVANVSFIPASGKRNKVLGFDTGPGMALIDECCNKFYGQAIDMDALHAIKGNIDETILNELMSHDFIKKNPPKSTGRNEFGVELLNSIIMKYPKVNTDDLIRTFCIFTAKSIAGNVNNFLNFSSLNKCMIISGGGTHHPVLMQAIKKYCDIKDILTSDEMGIQTDQKEALLMAVLGVARLQNMPANMPGVTGAKKRVILGELII